MLIQRINRTNPEKIFVLCFNSYATAAVTNGQGVIWDFATDANGVSITRPSARATNAGFAAAGVVAENINAGDYGLMQVFGYHSAVRARVLTGGTPAIAPGRPLAINAAGSLFCLETMATGTGVILVFPMAFALGSSTTFTTAAVPAFVKSL